ncbi:MAG: DNA polymerase I [Bacteroidales bacterium]|nr:DNA polymerase I [Bacteroidales bacterium]
MPKILFLLDAMALIYRAYYALNKNPRINSKGLNTSAILGFANTLYDVLKNEKPTHIGIAFDTMAPTVRHDNFAAYKANREAMPEDLSASIPWIIKLIKSFNIPILEVDGYEADDVIGTLAKEAEKQGFTVYMMTPDKDFGQLVSDKVFIFKPAKFGEKAVVMGVKEVCEKFGVERPEQVIDTLGLAGDASDNIPGIPGVGGVTARKLLAEYGSVENLVERRAEIKNEKLREKVEAWWEQALFSKQLATIILDVPIEFNEQALVVEQPDRENLKKVLDELEFRAFAKRVFTDLSPNQEISEKTATGTQGKLFDDFDPGNMVKGGTATIESTTHQYHLVETLAQRKQLVDKLKTCRNFCFDTETTGLNIHSSELVCISFAFEPHEAWCVMLPHNYQQALEIVQEFKPLFENSSIEKTGQNLKFDITMLRYYDTEVKSKLFDTMLAHYLLQPDLRHNLDYMARAYLNYQPVSIETLIGKKGKSQGTMRQVDPETLKEYACEDADITLQLRQVFEPMLAENDCLVLFNDIEIPLVSVLASMETEGVKLDIENLRDYSGQLQKEILETEKQIFEQAGMMFNIASPKQLGEVLFDRMKIASKPKQTSTKQHSTAEDVLSKLAHKHPIVPLILDYRSLTKLKSTYVDALPAMVNERTGRIHTSYNQAVTSTGRLSSNNPNLQNIPIRTERGREIRKAFVPRNEDYILLSADYSQIELRIIASLSGDPNMIEDFRQGRDIHAATASRIYNVALDEVNMEMRRNAKTVNFGIIYGISAFGLSERLNISRAEANDIINQYFTKYSGIKRYMEKQIALARIQGYVETIMKRRRYLRDILSSNNNVRGFAERNAINAPIQGSAADLIKIAMINIYQEIEKQQLRSRMIMQVHDELVFDVHRSELESVKQIVSKKMINALHLQVPVDIDMNSGSNWLEAH